MAETTAHRRGRLQMMMPTHDRKRWLIPMEDALAFGLKIETSANTRVGHSM